MTSFRPHLLILLLLSSLNGCYSQLPHSRPDSEPQPPNSAPVLRRLPPAPPVGSLAEARLKQLQTVTLPLDTIQPGDAFNLSVYGEPELELKGAVVRPDGKLSCPLIGDQTVAGLTVSQAREVIRVALKHYIRNPEPTLSAYAFAGRSFTIVGKVNRPGSYSLTQPLRVLDALGLAGGLSVGIIKNDSTELADLKHAYLVREQEILPVDFEALIRYGQTQHNIPLLPGDYLYVPSVAQQEVFVLGDVNEQNSFNFREGMSLSQVLAYAKGPKDSADLTQILLTRGRLQQPAVYALDYQAILKAQEPDVLLEPGDVIYVSAGPIKSFEQLMQVALPVLQAIQGGALLYQVVKPVNGS